MGRHKKMAAATTASSLTEHGVPTGADPWSQPAQAGPDLSDVDPERRRHIEDVEPKSVSADMTDVLRPWVVWCVTKVPFTAHQTDLKRIGQTYALLGEDLQLCGDVNPVRAFRFANVREHLERRRVGGMKPNSRNSIQSNLYAIGRVVAPKGYPPPRAMSTGRLHVRPAATEAQVRALELAAKRIRGVTGDRLRLILDLTTHAGARAREITQVRGKDLIEQQCDGRLVLLVRLTNRSSGIQRLVPVLDPVVASRLAARATAVGPGGPLLGTPGNLKNAVNKVLSRARELGVTVEVTADQLRYAFILRVAQAPIPATVMLSLTDLGDSHTLHELTKNAQPATLSQQVRMLAGVLR